MGNTFDKDSNAELDYTIDWGAWLGNDAISTSSWTAEDGLTVGVSTFNTTTTTVWLLGGTAGEEYRVTNRIATVGSRVDERTLVIRVVDK